MSASLFDDGRQKKCMVCVGRWLFFPPFFLAVYISQWREERALHQHQERKVIDQRTTTAVVLLSSRVMKLNTHKTPTAEKCQFQ
jgi:hypothetical protein